MRRKKYKLKRTEIDTAVSKHQSFFGAGDRDRTGTVLLPRDFKSLASANSATPATERYYTR